MKIVRSVTSISKRAPVRPSGRCLGGVRRPTQSPPTREIPRWGNRALDGVAGMQLVALHLSANICAQLRMSFLAP